MFSVVVGVSIVKKKFVFEGSKSCSSRDVLRRGVMRWMGYQLRYGKLELMELGPPVASRLAGSNWNNDVP